MLRKLRAVAWQNCTLLRRDQIFRVVVVAGVLITTGAGLASTWSIEDRIKILFDVGYFGLQLLGSLMGIFWGAKMVSDSRQDGAIEWQLAAPLSRPAWLLGKYLGLALTQLLLALGYGLMTDAQVAAYLMMVLGWLVLSALSVTLAVMMRFALALFACVGLWLTGLMSQAVASQLGPESSVYSQELVRGIARVWNLQYFNLIDRVLESRAITPASLSDQIGYGFLLVAITLTVSCLVFSKGDVVAN
jgi:ABC-type transport system involved in multi-copper enzyme maturation permease subunit